MITPIFYPYKIASNGAHALAEIFDTWCVYSNRKYRPRKNHIIICWGAAALPNWWSRVQAQNLPVINPPHRVSIAINKLRTLEALTQAKVNVPKWTQDRATASDWVSKDSIVVARKSLTSSAGRGIVVVDQSVRLPDCNLYTLHVRHKREFRVHVFNNRIIDIAEKRKRSDFDKEVGELDSLVRNWDNGWVFCHENVQCPEAVQREAMKAVEVLGLDFGAVDVGYREKDDKAYVFEVNTAPGIEGQTVQRYAQAVRQISGMI